MFEIVIVSRDNYIVFQPLLPEVISGSVELNHVISPIRRLAKTARLYTREVESIDLANRTVRLSPGAKPAPLTIAYDPLVIALGSRLDHSKIPGMREQHRRERFAARFVAARRSNSPRIDGRAWKIHP